jgi:hypothetical protein
MVPDMTISLTNGSPELERLKSRLALVYENNYGEVEA